MWIKQHRSPANIHPYTQVFKLAGWPLKGNLLWIVSLLNSNMGSITLMCSQERNCISSTYPLNRKRGLSMFFQKRTISSAKSDFFLSVKGPISMLYSDTLNQRFHSKNKEGRAQTASLSVAPKDGETVRCNFINSNPSFRGPIQ